MKNLLRGAGRYAGAHHFTGWEVHPTIAKMNAPRHALGTMARMDGLKNRLSEDKRSNCHQLHLNQLRDDGFPEALHFLVLRAEL